MTSMVTSVPLGDFATQTVGLDHHQELWIPAEELENFNNKIVNGIRVCKSHIGRKLILPEKIKNVLNQKTP